MLERFPNNLPRHRENVIPADSEKKSLEEVSGGANSSSCAGRVLGEAPALAFGARSRRSRESVQTTRC